MSKDFNQALIDYIKDAQSKFKTIVEMFKRVAIRLDKLENERNGDKSSEMDK